MEKSEWPAVRIKLRSGQTIRVIAEAIVGPYAVHQRIYDSLPRDNGFTVTHKASGVSIWNTCSYQDALKVANWLTEHKALPEQDEALREWLAAQNASQRTEFAMKLEQMAPRFRFNPDASQETVWS